MILTRIFERIMNFRWISWIDPPRIPVTTRITSNFSRESQPKPSFATRIMGGRFCYISWSSIISPWRVRVGIFLYTQYIHGKPSNGISPWCALMFYFIFAHLPKWYGGCHCEDQRGTFLSNLQGGAPHTREKALNSGSGIIAICPLGTRSWFPLWL